MISEEICHVQISVIHFLNSTTWRIPKEFINTAKEVHLSGRVGGGVFWIWEARGAIKCRRHPYIHISCGVTFVVH